VGEEAEANGEVIREAVYDDVGRGGYLHRSALKVGQRVSV
jgi:hypothetical protein